MFRSLEDSLEVFQHELRLLLYNPSTYLFQSFFLILLSVVIFIVADFMSTDDSSINLLSIAGPNQFCVDKYLEHTLQN